MTESQIEKWGRVSEKGFAILGFLEWCDYEGIDPLAESRLEVVYKYFDIDSTQLEKDRRELLEEWRRKSGE